MSKLRFLAALWMAKLIRLALKLLGRNATHFPGKIALKICPDFMGRIEKPKRVVAVTGTDGKTTVCNLINDILIASGQKVLSNPYGSNIDAGIATTLMEGASVFGKAKFELAILEVDERSVGRIFPHVKPDYVVIINLFRDSIMRNAHAEYIAGIINDNMPTTVKLIINGDDLISAGVAPENERVYFGIERLDTDITECVNIINDMPLCPVCREELVYDYRRYHHIGKAHCPACDFKSPEYDYAAGDVDVGAMTMTVSDKGGSGEYKLLSDSIFNIYNMVTAVAVLREIGLSHEKISAACEKIKITASRYNVVRVGEIDIVMQMAKDINALACSRVFEYVASKPGKKELVFMMYSITTEVNWSENVSWLYDCDFEFLNHEDITRIVVIGPRMWDYYMRLRLAGIPEEKIRCAQEDIVAPEQLELEKGESVYIFYGTDNIPITYKVRDKIKRLIEEREAR